MNRIHYRIRRFCAILVGFVFLISGMFKIIDPVGATLVVREYFNFFHIGFLKGIAGAVAVALSVLETLTGAALITAAYRRLSAAVAGLMLSFFTFVTILLVIFNPAMDCGCFGEIIQLTHWQSFIKNIVLCVFAAVAFLPFRDFGYHKNRKLIPFWTVACIVAGLSVYSHLYLPLRDYTPFRLSSTLAVIAPESVSPEDIEPVFIYEKNGKKAEFTMASLPDSTWTFVRAETPEIPVSDAPELTFRDSGDNYRDSLAAEGSVLVISVYDTGKMDRWDDVEKVMTDAAAFGFTPLLIMASTPETAAGILPPELLGATYYSDYKTLISMNRSNGGATYFNEGNLIRKWAFRSLPSYGTLEELAGEDPTSAMLSADTRGRIAFQSIMLFIISIMILV